MLFFTAFYNFSAKNLNLSWPSLSVISKAQWPIHIVAFFWQNILIYSLCAQLTNVYAFWLLNLKFITAKLCLYHVTRKLLETVQTLDSYYRAYSESPAAQATFSLSQIVSAKHFLIVQFYFQQREPIVSLQWNRFSFVGAAANF